MIKEIRVQNAKQRAAAKTEAELLALCGNHAHIVQLFGVEESPRGVRLLMQYCSGGTLYTHLRESCLERVDEILVWRWLQQLCSALQHIHEKGILHRDIKSKNIFLHKGNLVLGDFGISKKLQHGVSMTRTMVGTPYYLAPELCVRNIAGYGQANDLWALGIVLYEIVTLGHHPFEAENIPDLLKQIRHQAAPGVEGYSQSLTQVLNGLLQKDPLQRISLEAILSSRMQYESIERLFAETIAQLPQSRFDALERLEERLEELIGRKRWLCITYTPENTTISPAEHILVRNYRKIQEICELLQ